MLFCWEATGSLWRAFLPTRLSDLHSISWHAGLSLAPARFARCAPICINWVKPRPRDDLYGAKYCWVNPLLAATCAAFWIFHGSLGFLIGGAALYAKHFRWEAVESQAVSGAATSTVPREKGAGQLPAICCSRNKDFCCSRLARMLPPQAKTHVPACVMAARWQAPTCTAPPLCSWHQQQWITGYGNFAGSVWFLLGALGALLEQANPRHP